MKRLAKSKRSRKAAPYEPAHRSFVTPEGVDLRLQPGSYTERAMACLLDFLILGAGFLAFTIAIGLTSVVTNNLGGAAQEILLATWLLGGFVARNFYFIAFEAGPRAATPGKRAMGLRVVSADGGPLTADAVFTRNATREIEVLLPLSFIASAAAQRSALFAIMSLVWALTFMLLPMFNRDRMRLGDVAAGAMVIRTRRAKLAADLASQPVRSDVSIHFTDSQLDAYGEKELHVLAQVLRSGDRRTLADVARRIRRKIDWEAPEGETDRAFLTAYYTALRERLEKGLVMGRRRTDKHDRAGAT